MNKKNRKGFTIVELVIVIAVIGILATVLIPTFGDVIGKANASADLQAAKNAYTDYMVDNAAKGEDDFIIKGGDNAYFIVLNGQMSKTVYADFTKAAEGFTGYTVTPAAETGTVTPVTLTAKSGT